MIRRVLMSVACAALMSVPAAAQDTKITEAMVHEFSERHNASFKLPMAEYIALIKKSHSTDFRGTVATITSGPGIPPTSDSGITDYKKMIDRAEIVYKAMQEATIQTKISSIRIAADGRNVTVTEATRITGMKGTGPKAEIYMDGDITCENEMALSAEEILQLVKSTCTAESKITDIREL